MQDPLTVMQLYTAPASFAQSALYRQPDHSESKIFYFNFRDPSRDNRSSEQISEGRINAAAVVPSISGLRRPGRRLQEERGGPLVPGSPAARSRPGILEEEAIQADDRLQV